MCDGQGRQEETHAAHVFGSADLRVGKDIRTDEVPRGPRAGEARLRPGHVGESGQGKTTIYCILDEGRNKSINGWGGKISEWMN